MNFNPAVSFIVLILAVISVAWVLSILPQGIIWMLFIVALGFAALQIKNRC